MSEPKQAFEEVPDRDNELCTLCGCSLPTLPVAGRCPFCGCAYDRSELLLYGWGRGRFENLATAKRSRIFKLIWAGYATQVFLLLNGHGSNLVYVSLLVFLPSCFQIMRRRQSPNPGLIQVRLNACGCAQHNTQEGLPLFQQLIGAYSWIIPLFAIPVLIPPLLVSHSGLAAIQFEIFAPIAAICSVVLWKLTQRFRDSETKIAAGASSETKKRDSDQTEWENVEDYILIPIERAHYRLRIRHKGGTQSGWRQKPLADVVVDAEIECTSEQAQRIQQLLTKYAPLKNRTEGKDSVRPRTFVDMQRRQTQKAMLD